MSDESMQQQLVAWVASKALCTTIREYQMGPIPRLPYISIHYVQSKQIRDWPRHFVYEDADQEVPPRIWAGPVLEVEYMFSLSAFSSYSPSDLLRPIRSAIQVTQANEPLMPTFQIHEMSEIRNLSEWDNDIWNNRAQADLYLRGLEADGHLVDTIEEYNFIFNRRV